MANRPPGWLKIVDANAETCYWLAPDGTRYSATEDENAEVHRDLLNMRTMSDKRRQQHTGEPLRPAD